MSFMMKGLRGLRDGLADALVVEDGEVDEDGNFIVYHSHTDSGEEEDDDEGRLDGGEGGGGSDGGTGPARTHRPSENSNGSSNSASAVSQLHVDVFKERYERVRDELARFREEAAAQAAELRREVERLKAQSAAAPQAVAGNDSGGSPSNGGSGSGGGGAVPGAGGAPTASRELEDMRDEVASLCASKAALATALAEERRRSAGLCDSFDAAQAEKLQLQLRWQRHQQSARAHVGALRAKYPDLAGNGIAEEGPSASASANGVTVSANNPSSTGNTPRDLLEDLVFLKQAINDAIVKVHPPSGGATAAVDGSGGEGDNTNSSVGVEAGAKPGSQQQQQQAGDGSHDEGASPQPLDLRSAPVQAFAVTLQQLVRSAILHGAGDGHQDAGLRLQVERLRERLAASDEARATAVKTAEEISQEMADRLLRAEEGAEVLRQQRAAGEARQDQLMEQVATLCREKDEVLDQKQRGQSALHSAWRIATAARSAAEKQVHKLTRKQAKLLAELEKKKVTWDEYAMLQARLEESEDLCKQQAEKLAVLALERDEATATVERLRQQQVVMRDRVAALSSDLAIRDEDARQGATQLENLGAAMQRQEIEAQVQREALRGEVADLGTRLAAADAAHGDAVAAAVQACRDEASGELRLRDAKLTQLAGELQAAHFARDMALQKLREAAPEASVDRRLVATMLGSFFRARGQARKQAEILSLVAKVLDDEELVVLGAPQSLAGKAGSLLGRMWGGGRREGGDGGPGPTSEAATFGDLWMEFLVKEAGGEPQPHEGDGAAQQPEQQLQQQQQQQQQQQSIVAPGAVPAAASVQQAGGVGATGGGGSGN